MEQEIEYWIANADSFLHQIFLIVMAGLYAFAQGLGVSYMAVNIYVYFVLFPLSFSVVMKGWKKFLFIPVSLLFFLVPKFEQVSVRLFKSSVDFLNYTAEIFNSDYITMSVYVCVLLPVLLYLPFLMARLTTRKLSLLFKSSLIVFCTYMLLVYPNFKILLIYLKDHYLY